MKKSYIVIGIIVGILLIDEDFFFDIVDFIFGMVLDAPALWLENWIRFDLLPKSDYSEMIASILSSMIVYSVYGLIIIRIIYFKCKGDNK